MSQQGQLDAFLDMLCAAMLSAAEERQMTQLLSVITPPGKTRPVKVRVIVVPENMDHEWSEPLGSKQ